LRRLPLVDDVLDHLHQGFPYVRWKKLEVQMTVYPSGFTRTYTVGVLPAQAMSIIGSSHISLLCPDGRRRTRGPCICQRSNRKSGRCLTHAPPSTINTGAVYAPLRLLRGQGDYGSMPLTRTPSRRVSQRPLTSVHQIIAWLAESSRVDWSCPSQHAIHIVPVVVHRVHASPDAYTSVNNCTAGWESDLCMLPVSNNVSVSLPDDPYVGGLSHSIQRLVTIDHTFKFVQQNKAWRLLHYMHHTLASYRSLSSHM
jgi:hypothetical protein